MKKIFIYISCIALLAAILVAPVSADEYLDSFNGTNYIDLLYGSPIYYGSTRGYENNLYTDVLNFNNARLYLKWDPPYVGAKLSTVFITIYASQIPDLAPLLYISSTSASITGTHMGSQGNFHQYRFYFTSAAVSELTLAIRYNNTADRQLGITNCLGFGTFYENVNSFNFYRYDYYVGTIDNSVYLDRELGNSSSGISFPHFDSIAGSNYVESDLYIDIPEAMHNEKIYSKVSILIDVVGDVKSTSCSLYSAGSYLPNILIPDDAIYTRAFKTVDSGFFEYKWPYFTYLIEVDLTGINTAGYTLNFQVSITGLDTGLGQLPGQSQVPESEGIAYNIRAVWFDQYIIQEAWYVRMWNWISGGFDRVVDAIKGEEPSDLENGAAQIGSAAQENLQNEAVLESVPAPTVDSDEMLGGFLTDLGAEIEQDPSTGLIGNTGAVLTTVTNNKYISSIILVTVTFAVIGYIFFGKKG